MEAKIDSAVCIACGLCPDICPEVFKMKDDTAIVIESPVPEEVVDAVRDAVETCPVGAIVIEGD